MKQRIITPEDLKKYMGGVQYDAFIKDLKKKMKVKKKECIWIIAEDKDTMELST